MRDDGPGFATPLLAATGVRSSSKADGFGVGLTLVRTITELSGGRVGFTNGPRGGALVELILPGRRERVGPPRRWRLEQ